MPLHYYDAPPKEELLTQLAGHLTVRRRPSTQIKVDHFDTFDGRFFKKGETLALVTAKGGSEWQWRDAATMSLLGKSSNPQARFAWDFPRGAFRKKIEKTLEMRALIHLVSFNISTSQIDILNSDEKIVVRLFVEQYEIGGNPETPGPMTRLRVEPVRGYDGQLQKVIAALEEKLRLAPAEGTLIENILDAAGVAPPTYASKVKVPLSPQMPAIEALRKILLRLLEVMETNEEGTIADIDSEYLHDFRVAVRRTRSALSQVKGVLDKGALGRFKPDFAWLGQVTGPTRDLDVYELMIRDHTETLDAQQAEALTPFIKFLSKRQRAEQKKLARHLKAQRYGKLKAKWEELLGADADQIAGARGRDPIGEVADKRILKAFHLALDEGDAINDDSPAEMLHELRKTCKKLRYLLEFFRTIYPDKQINPFISSLKGLQDNLGEFQDLAVQTEAISHFGKEMADEGKAPPETLMELGRLMEALMRRDEEVRDEFAERFSSFRSDENVARMRAMTGRKK